MPVGAEAGQAAGRNRVAAGRDGSGTSKDRVGGGKITGAGGGLGATRDRVGGNQITSKESAL